MAEQLAVLDPTAFDDLEDLRLQLLENIDNCLDESEHLQWYRASQQFAFIRSQIVVSDTQIAFDNPIDMSRSIASITLSGSIVLYHFNDVRTESKLKPTSSVTG